MGVGVGTILRRYVTHALRNPSATFLSDFGGVDPITFRLCEAGRETIRSRSAPDGSFAFVDDGAPMEVSGIGITGNGRPIYSEAIGSVAVRVNDRGDGRSRDRAYRYGEATQRALFTGNWTGFVDESGRALALSHFDFYVGGRLQPSRILSFTVPDGEPYYLVVTQYRGTASPTA